MLVDSLAIWLFALAAIMLLGSPGPGIAALVSVGKDRGFVGGLRFYSRHGRRHLFRNAPRFDLPRQRRHGSRAASVAPLRDCLYGAAR